MEGVMVNCDVRNGTYSCSCPGTSGAGTISGQGGKTQSAKAFNAKYGSSLKLDCFLSQKPAFSKKKVINGFGVCVFGPKFNVL